MEIVYHPGSAFGVGAPNISWTEAMEMDYPMFQLVRDTVIELRNREIEDLKKMNNKTSR